MFQFVMIYNMLLGSDIKMMIAVVRYDSSVCAREDFKRKKKKTKLVDKSTPTKN